METSSYAVKQLAEALRSARIARGLSQRELAERASLGQSRLALIEAGKADLRTSTLVQLARALDLELVLAPRRVLPAVQSLTEGQPGDGPEVGRHSVRGTPIRVLRRIQQHLSALERAHPSSEELAKTRSTVQALIELGPHLGTATLQPLRRSLHWVALARTNKPKFAELLTKAAGQLNELRQLLPVLGRLDQAPQTQRAAYSLADEIS